MTDSAYYFARIIFKNRIHTCTGQQFEDFFVSVMTKSNKNFQSVKAYGNIGDMKNDGFDKTTGTYYQVFAPDDITKSATIHEAVKKLRQDFEGLYKKWNEICKVTAYYFVINDKYSGVSAPIQQEIIKIEIEYNISINLFTAKDLEYVFNKLTEDDKQDILGFIPDFEIPLIEYTVLHETVMYLLNVDMPIGKGNDTLNVPDFENKLCFNKLSPQVHAELVTGSYQEGMLKDYFAENPGVKDILQKKFHGFYEQSKERIPDTQENFSDCRFYYIQESACMKKTLPVKACVLVLMSYYFESCDIFEEPK